MATTTAIRRNSRQLLLRLTRQHKRTLLEAARALSTPGAHLTPGQLLTAAGLEEAARLGFFPSLERAEATDTLVTRGAPPRGEVPRDATLSLTVHPLLLRPITEAAAAHGMTAQAFLLAAAWRFLRRRQRAERGNAPLRKLQLPTRTPRP